MGRWTGAERVMLATLALVGVGTAFLMAAWIASGATGAPPSPGGFAIITAVGGNFAVHRAIRVGRSLRPIEIALLSFLTGATIALGAAGIAAGDRWEKIYSAVFIVAVIVSIIGLYLQLRKARTPGPDDQPAQTVGG